MKKSKMDHVEAGKTKPTILGDVALLVDLRRLNQAVEQLVNMNHVCALYTTTGNSNLKVKIVAEDIRQFHKIVIERIGSIQGLNVVSTNLITEVIKEIALGQ